MYTMIDGRPWFVSLASRLPPIPVVDYCVVRVGGTCLALLPTVLPPGLALALRRLIHSLTLLNLFSLIFALCDYSSMVSPPSSVRP